MNRGLFSKVICISFSLALFGFAYPAYAKDDPASGGVQVSEKELGDLVQMIEDPKKREVFLKDLKGLLRAKELVSKETSEKKGRRLFAVENLFKRFDSFTAKISELESGLSRVIAGIPGALGDAKSFLSGENNRSRLMTFFLNLGVAILLALAALWPTRKAIGKITQRVRGVSSKVLIGLLMILLETLPAIVSLVAVFVLFDLFPSFPLAQSIALLFFSILIFYRLALALFRVLLSPEKETIRILSIADESANYYWIWIQRFANYSGFYFLITYILSLFEPSAQNFMVIRGILLLTFPLMLSVFIFQIAKDLRLKLANLKKEGEGPHKKWGRIYGPLLKYWPILAVCYTWVIFLFTIFNYEKGFEYLIKSTLGTVITVIALVLASELLHLLFRRLFAVNEKVKARFPGLEEKTNRYIRILQKILGKIMGIIALGVIANIWGIPVGSIVASKTGSLIILRALAILATAGVVLAIIETSQFLSDQILKAKRWKKRETKQKLKTLVPIVRTAIKIAVGFVGGIVILEQLGVNTGPVLAGAGIIGLAVGFGSQTLVKDLINGLFILFEESVRVGDYADLGKHAGTVEAVGLRTIRLRDVNGNVHVVPNSSIESLTNMSKEYSRSVVDIGVAYKEDVDEVMEILKGVGEDLQKDPKYGTNMIEPLEIFGLQSFEDSAVVIRVRLTTKPLKQWGMKREFQRRVKKVFDQQGIEIPFPHRTIYMGELKDGSSPPLKVDLKGPIKAQEESG
jgi:small-conductance mechanosensitive channel